MRGTRGTADTDLYRAYLRTYTPRGPAPLSAVLGHCVNGVRLTAAGPRLLWSKLTGHTPYHGIDRMLGEFYRCVQRDDAPPITPRGDHSHGRADRMR